VAKRIQGERCRASHGIIDHELGSQRKPPSIQNRVHETALQNHLLLAEIASSCIFAAACMQACPVVRARAEGSARQHACGCATAADFSNMKQLCRSSIDVVIFRKATEGKRGGAYHGVGSHARGRDATDSLCRLLGPPFLFLKTPPSPPLSLDVHAISV